MSKDYKRLDPSRITSTVGLNTGQVEVTGMSIQFWDLGGQSELQSLWDKVGFPGFNIGLFKICLLF